MVGSPLPGGGSYGGSSSTAGTGSTSSGGVGGTPPGGQGRTQQGSQGGNQPSKPGQQPLNESDALEGALIRIELALDISELLAAIDAALATKPPAGDPTIITGQADSYGFAANMCNQVIGDVQKVKTQSLPSAWRGQAADSADLALLSLDWQADAARDAFGASSKTLTTWANQLAEAQLQDAHGREQLETAKGDLQGVEILDPFSSPAKHAAVSGCHDCWAAANLADGAASVASAALSTWPDQARAQQIRVPGVDALTAVALAYNGNHRTVLTPTAASLASKHLDAMSLADRAAFERLVAHASSLTEAEYLWKAASAGYNVGQLKSFDAVIRPHGNDMGWLEQHLDPGIITGPPVPGNAPLPGRAGVPAGFDQGQQPYCVPDAAVMARLAADPVLTLGVTTGRGPAAVGGAKVGEDSQTAIAARAQNLFGQYYSYGRAADDHKFLGIIPDEGLQPPGIDPSKGGIAIDNRALTSVTGSTYHYQALNNMADRQAALPKMEAAAEAGKPVPIGEETTGLFPEGHQMVIEDYRNGEFEIYNPWGYTQWVSTKQFVDGDLSPVFKGYEPDVPHPTDVELPDQ